MAGDGKSLSNARRIGLYVAASLLLCGTVVPLLIGVGVPVPLPRLLRAPIERFFFGPPPPPPVRRPRRDDGPAHLVLPPLKIASARPDIAPHLFDLPSVHRRPPEHEDPPAPSEEEPPAPPVTEKQGPHSAPVSTPSKATAPVPGHAEDTFKGEAAPEVHLDTNADSQKPAALQTLPERKAEARVENSSAPVPVEKKEKGHIEKKESTPALARADTEQLSQMYAKQDLARLASHIPVGKSKEPAVALDTGGSLTAEQVLATISKFQSGFTSCIDRELKRNPNFPGGKIRIAATIASSGIVQKAEIQGDDPILTRTVARAELGGCLVTQTRHIVFPTFTGAPTDVEIPLVLGSSL